MRKEEEELQKFEGMSEEKLKETLSAPYAVSDIVVALSKIVESDTMFDKLKSLAETIGGSDGALTEQAVRNTVVEAEIDLEVDAALEKKAQEEAERAAKAKSKKDDKPSEQEKIATKVGLVILNGVKAQRRLFGQVMSSFRSFFDLSSRTEGHLSKDAFKEVLVRLDVTLSPAQLLELFKVSLYRLCTMHAPVNNSCTHTVCVHPCTIPMMQ